MELGAHYVMIVSGQYTDASAALPVPDPYGLIVRCTEDPGILLMKHCGSDVVQVTQQREDTSSLLVVPDFDLVIVTAGDEQRLLIVEAYASDRPVVLVEFVEQSAHTVVPQLDNAIVQAVICTNVRYLQCFIRLNNVSSNRAYATR